MSLEFQLMFAGVPFVTDDGVNASSLLPQEGEQGQEPAASLYEEVDQMIPFDYLKDMKSPPSFPGRNLGEIAFQESNLPRVRVGDWYYPTGASRWSVFRGLATSTQAKAMLAATGGYLPKTLTMKVAPQSPGNPKDKSSDYTVSTSMYMLPPRPLGEDSGGWDGLYLITLVDERFYFQGTGVSLTPDRDSTWEGLLGQIAGELGVTFTYESIPTVYGKPEPDSHLWATQEGVSILLDAIALNLGRVVVRRMDGSYRLEDYATSSTLVDANRKRGKVIIRHAGGDLFYPGNKLPAGSLSKARNSVVPQTFTVAFPKYVQGDDPVPHFLNPRYQAGRESCWYEDGYGTAYTVSTPASSGGTFTSGLVGTSEQVVHSTAKALLDFEWSPRLQNTSGLTSLARQMAQDFYGWQVVKALDEVYEGTVAWTPEGFHDILWTYSCRLGGAFTRVMKSEWNQTCREFQHSTPVPDQDFSTPRPRGVGGPSLALTIQDQTSGVITNTITSFLRIPEDIPGGLSPAAQSLFATFSGNVIGLFRGINFLPTNERWVGKVGFTPGEEVLFEGASGGLGFSTGAGNVTYMVTVAKRGMNGTVATPLIRDTTVTVVLPNTVYGNNLITFGRSQFIAPSHMTSGGVTATKVIPQVQTIGVGASLSGMISERGLWCWNASVIYADSFYSPGGGGQQVYVVERNDFPLTLSGESSISVLGQFVGWSTDGQRPVYLADRKPSVLSKTCGPLTWDEYQVRCDTGTSGSTLKQYKRTETISFTSGACPVLIDGSWSLDTDLSQCLGDIYYVVNYFNTVNFFDTVNFYGAVNFNNLAIFTGGLEVCGWMFWCCTNISFGGSQTHNWEQPEDEDTGEGQVVYVVLSGTELTGIIPAKDEPDVLFGGPQVIVFTNNTGVTLTLKHEDPGSSAPYRFHLPNEEELTIPSNGGAILWYDTCSSQRWKVLSGSGGGGDGCDSTVTWDEYRSTCTNGQLRREVRTRTLKTVKGCLETTATPWATELTLECACPCPTVADTCCPDPMPTTLYVTFSNGTGVFANISGLTFQLTYIGNHHWSYNQAQSPAFHWYLDLECAGSPGWQLDLTNLVETCGGFGGMGTIQGSSSADGASTCNPAYSANSITAVLDPGCEGFVSFVITETPP